MLHHHKNTRGGEPAYLGNSTGHGWCPAGAADSWSRSLITCHAVGTLTTGQAVPIGEFSSQDQPEAR